MDAQQFLAEFGHIANAPGGVGRLRRLVLALAVQGRLVTQEESDEPASRQLTRIKKIAASIPSTGRRKKSTAAVQKGDVRKTMPLGWTSARLCEVLRVLNGRAYSKQELLESGTPVLRVGNLFTAGHWYYSNLELEADKYCDAGDLLFAWSASFGPFIWQGKRVIYHYHIWKLDLFSGDELNKNFVYTWLLEKTQEIKAAGHGISMAHMTKERFEQLEINLPPLREQARIVAKVDELMALCDQLEKQQQDRRKLQNALRQSTLQALAGAESPHELLESWQGLSENWQHLFSVPEDVDALRETVLDLAARGSLSERFTSDEPADQLLSRCRKQKASRLASGQMKRKTASATDVIQPDLAIPKHWSRASLDELFQFIDYRGRTPTKTQSGVVLVTAKNVRPGRLHRQPVEHISPKGYDAWMTRGLPKQGDLLITTEAPLGNVAQIEDQPTFALAQRVIDLQPFADLNTRCAMFFMMSPMFQRLLDLNSSGMAAKGIKAAKLKQLEIPIPPREEQARIVQIVNRLLGLCDRQAELLAKCRKLAESLAAASVAAITGFTLSVEEDSPMKAPQTELIAPLRLGTPPPAKDWAPLAHLLAHNRGELSARELWQRYGGEIDAFYAQLKTEVERGWIVEPALAEMRVKAAEAEGA